MLFPYALIAAAIVQLASCQGRGYIQPRSEASIAIGGGFVVYLEVPATFGDIRNCSLVFDDERIAIKATNLPIRNSSAVISPYSDTKCGIRAENLTIRAPTQWTLEATNDFDEKISDSIRIRLFAGPPNRFNTTIKRPIGEATVECTRFPSTKACSINGVADKCETAIFVREDTSVECRTSSWGSLEESVETILVRVEDRVPYTTASFEETSRRYNLTCQFSSAVANCRARMPNGRTEVIIANGMNNGRYTTYQTNDTCTVEIAKVLDDSEVGLWTILDTHAGSKTGCLFYVGDSKENVVQRELAKLNRTQQIATQAGEHDKIAVTCRAPYALDHCYMIDDDSNIYFPDASFNKTRFVGECVFSSLRCAPGKWTCGMASNASAQHVVQRFEITYKSKTAEALTSFIKAKEDNSAVLLCKSPEEQPIKACALFAPTGRVYLIEPNVTIEGNRIEYYGRGLTEGDCGISINRLEKPDFGQWTCQMNLYTRQYVPKFYMYIDEDEDVGKYIAMLGFWGVVGIAVVGMIAACLLCYCRQRRRRNNDWRL